MKQLILWSTMIVMTAGCGPRTDIADETAQAPTAASVAPISGMPLDTALALLDNELRAAIDNKLDDTGFERFQRAEALTDRLLETRTPFQWLKQDSYSVEAKLRQIQALADRVLAKVGAMMPRDSAMPDLRLAHEQVLALRQALKYGGTKGPIALEKLMAGQDTAGMSTDVPAPTVVDR